MIPISPGDRLPLRLDWSAWLDAATAEAGATVLLESAVATTTGTLAVDDGPDLVDADTQVRVWLSAEAMSAGDVGSVTVEVTTDAGHVARHTVTYRAVP